jgi:hypothetical protein
MKPAIIVFLFVAITALTAQTIRHAYMLWLQPQRSVLEKYNPAAQNKIKNADSLEALEKEYAIAQNEVAKADEEIKKSGRRINRFEDEPFKTERLLKTAIEQWERRSGEIGKAWFSWGCGLGLVLAGLLFSIRHRWLGLSFIVAGLTQMIWWVSPSFSFNEASSEYRRMLENKFILSLVTLFLVLSLWFLFDRRNRKELGGKPEKGC